MISDRIRSFWSSGLAEGPLVSVWLPESPADLRHWDLSEQRTLWQQRRGLRDDSVPHVALSNDAETLTALLGGTVEHSSGSSWAKPVLASPADLSPVRFDPNAPLYRELVRRMEAARAAPELAIKMIPLSGVSDLFSALRGNQDAMMDVLEDPDAVITLVNHLADCARAVAEDLLQRMPRHEGGTLGGLAWVPGRGATLSADMMIMCRPEWFRDYIWPAEQRLLETFDHAIYHLHSGGSGPALAQWIAPHSRICAVEISHDPAGPSLESLHKILTGIQAHTRLLVTCWSRRFTDDELTWMASHLDARRLYLFQRTDDLAEGQAFLARVRSQRWSRS